MNHKRSSSFLRAWLARVKWRDVKAAAALKLEIEARVSEASRGGAASECARA